MSITDVRIVEESTLTGGNYKADIFTYTYELGMNSYILSYPFPISVLTIKILSPDRSVKNNSIDLVLNPDKIIGTITKDVNINDDIIYVSSSVLENTMLGYNIKLDDLSNNHIGNRIINIDTSNNCITLETPSIKKFSTLTPTFIKLNIYILKDYKLIHNDSHIFGDDKIGGMYIPANTMIQLNYNNKSPYKGDIAIKCDYLY